MATSKSTWTTASMAILVIGVFTAYIANRQPGKDSKGRPRIVLPDGSVVQTRICLNMLLHNEESEIIRCLENLKGHISGYMLCDTGSTDKTPELAQAFLKKFHVPGTLEYHEWKNFSHNRNKCMDRARELMGDTCDYLLLLEPDHVLVSENRVPLLSLKLTEDAYKLQERDQSVAYYNDKLLSTSLPWKYVGAVHEYISLDDARTNVTDYTRGDLPQGIYAWHMIDYSVEKYEKYLKLLLADYEVDPDNVRTMFYLGQTYTSLKNPDKALQAYVKRALMGGWDEEAYVAGLSAANILEDLWDQKTAMSQDAWGQVNKWASVKGTIPTLEEVAYAYQTVADSLPYRKEAWYHLAKIAREHYNNHEVCFNATEMARTTPDHGSFTLFSRNSILDFQLDDETCVCAYYVPGKQIVGLRACYRLQQKLLSMGPALQEWHQKILDRTNSNLQWYLTGSGPKGSPEDAVAKEEDEGASAARPPKPPAAVRLPLWLPRTPKVFFHSTQLTNRGSEVAVFDYGFWLERFFHAEAHFAIPYPGWREPDESALAKFLTAFPGRVHFIYEEVYSARKYRIAMDEEIKYYKGDVLYRIELPHPPYEVSKIVPTLVHEVFSCEPDRVKGTKYKAISTFVQDHLGGACTGSVPHIAWMPDCGGVNLRAELGIPEDAFVFAWYGGHDAWDPTVTKIVQNVAAKRGKDVFFLFQNLPPEDALELSTFENVRLLRSTANLWHKCKVVNTADVFLHVRRLGETFGIAVAEFTISGKPVITSSVTPHKFHLEQLGEYAHTYSTYDQLERIMMNMTRENSRAVPELRQLYREYSPCKVMKKFNEEFFDGKLRLRGNVLSEFCAENWQLVPSSEEGKVLGVQLV